MDELIYLVENGFELVYRGISLDRTSVFCSYPSTMSPWTIRHCGYACKFFLQLDHGRSIERYICTQCYKNAPIPKNLPKNWETIYKLLRVA